MSASRCLSDHAGATEGAMRKITLSRKLLRDMREVVIVTIGIMIAFGLNAWWEYHKERRIEQVQLRALHADFEANVSRLKDIIVREERIQSASQNLLNMTSGDKRQPSQAVFELLAQVFSSTRFEPVMGAYEELVSSSGLALIRNEKLRMTLTGFASRLNTRYSEAFSNELYFEKASEYRVLRRDANPVNVMRNFSLRM